MIYKQDFYSILKNSDWGIISFGTFFLGPQVNNGNPKSPDIEYSLPGNIFILGAFDGVYLKMIKIRVLGEATYEYINGKYFDILIEPTLCTKQETFTEECFHGTSVPNSIDYNLVLNATVMSGTKTNMVSAKSLVNPNYITGLLLYTTEVFYSTFRNTCIGNMR